MSRLCGTAVHSCQQGSPARKANARAPDCFSTLRNNRSRARAAPSAAKADCMEVLAARLKPCPSQNGFTKHKTDLQNTLKRCPSQNGFAKHETDIPRRAPKRKRGRRRNTLPKRKRGRRRNDRPRSWRFRTLVNVYANKCLCRDQRFQSYAVRNHQSRSALRNEMLLFEACEQAAYGFS